MINDSATQFLILNSGSSSLKFALYRVDTDQIRMSGKLTRIGQPGAHFAVSTDSGPRTEPLDLPDHAAAGNWLFDWLAKQPGHRLDAVGHRFVHGGTRYRSPRSVTPELLAGLRPLIPFAPDHLPAEICLVETISRRYPDVPQVVCFDTAFHQTLPDYARQLPLPRRFREAGLVRYGFHGLSCEYTLSQLDPATASGRVIVAHLGNGASMTAVLNGQSVDTTMGFTPTGGLMMGARTGDLDPGVLLYLLTDRRLDAPALSHLLNNESGLLGVSALSADMQALVEAAPANPRAAEAVRLFGYVAKKHLGALVAVLNGLDTLVFTGGIGENAPAIRADLCAQLDYLGITIDSVRNARNEPIISPDHSRVTVRVIPTNEELMIARHTRDLLSTIDQLITA
ncbi:MAG: acetate/propionate family kinase [Bacteroidetes bacterium]|nr:acetate/propionate family kinase [Fibrella sp.]